MIFVLNSSESFIEIFEGEYGTICQVLPSTYYYNKLEFIRALRYFIGSLRREEVVLSTGNVNIITICVKI
jgi:hypothetical protein